MFPGAAAAAAGGCTAGKGPQKGKTPGGKPGNMPGATVDETGTKEILNNPGEGSENVFVLFSLLILQSPRKVHIMICGLVSQNLSHYV